MTKGAWVGSTEAFGKRFWRCNSRKISDFVEAAEDKIRENFEVYAEINVCHSTLKLCQFWEIYQFWMPFFTISEKKKKLKVSNSKNLDANMPK